MKRLIKNCGNCCYFLKLKNYKYSGGMCFAKDKRTNTDSGHSCSDWKPKPYVRLRIKKVEIE